MKSGMNVNAVNLAVRLVDVNVDGCACVESVNAFSGVKENLALAIISTVMIRGTAA